MSQALYRKWRPQNFSEVINQEHIKKILNNAISNGRVVHAYLFYGPRGTGKTTLARILAKSVNCEKFKNDPCGKCSSCQDFSQNKTMDLVEIDAASNRGIEEIKDLREKVKFSPTKGKYKIFVIDEVHMLTKEAFNALLKTLEEPPAHVIFILATTEVHKIPQTILSRCQRLDFKKLSQENLIKRIDYLAKKEKLSIEDGAKKIIAKVAQGAARDADSFLDLIISHGLTKITTSEVEEILGATEPEKIENLYLALKKNDGPLALSYVDQISQEGKDLIQFSNNLIEFLREKLVDKPSKKRANWIKVFCQAQNEMKRSPFPQLCLELAIVDIIDESELDHLENNNSAKTHQIQKTKTDSTRPESQIKTQTDIKPEEEKNGGIKNKNNNERAEQLDWKQVIRSLRGENNTLCFILENCQVDKIVNDKIYLLANFDFHKNRIDEPKNRKIIEHTIKKLTGCDMKVFCEISNKKIQTQSENPPEKSQNFEKNLNEIFEVENV